MWSGSNTTSVLQARGSDATSYSTGGRNASHCQQSLNICDLHTTELWAASSSMGLLGIEQGVASMMECLCPFAGLVCACWKLLSWICLKLRSAITVVGNVWYCYLALVMYCEWQPSIVCSHLAWSLLRRLGQHTGGEREFSWLCWSEATSWTQVVYIDSIWEFVSIYSRPSTTKIIFVCQD